MSSPAARGSAGKKAGFASAVGGLQEILAERHTDENLTAWNRVAREMAPEKQRFHATAMLKVVHRRVMRRLARRDLVSLGSNQVRAESLLNVDLERTIGHAGLDTHLLSRMRVEDAATRNLHRQALLKRRREERAAAERTCTPPGLRGPQRMEWRLERAWQEGLERDAQVLREWRRKERDREAKEAAQRTKKGRRRSRALMPSGSTLDLLPVLGLCSANKEATPRSPVTLKGTCRSALVLGRLAPRPSKLPTPSMPSGRHSLPPVAIPPAESGRPAVPQADAEPSALPALPPLRLVPREGPTHEVVG
eukprot:TRINITY_DN1902_c0_g2_i2.p1 TRINITY_DN1902_c0_g2~~TRINITY_DN1902_c0_g2_i2.p1  ORF type:complete len:307 (+),score=91.80 TRINITY_DN1902_c0_g2_i2:73-993(+)